MRKKMKVNFDTLELILNIIIFSIIIAIQLLGTFIPGIGEWVNENLMGALTAILIITIYGKVIRLSKKSKITSSKFDEAVISILEKKSIFHNVRIFADSAENYLKHLKEHKNIHIKNLYLLLKRIDKNQSWFVRMENIEEYRTELGKVLDEVEALQEEGRIDNIGIRFYDFECYSHFGIFDHYLVSGLLIPSSLSRANISDVQLFGMNPEFLSDDAVFESYMHFFNSNYEMSSLDSGLKRKEKNCKFCEKINIITSENYIPDRNTFEVALTKNSPLFPDFIVKPDLCPISGLHLLLVSQFHITSLYDFLRHSGAAEEVELLVKRIRSVIDKHYHKDIIVFEHGSITAKAELSGSSVDHFHLHVIYKPDNFDYDEAIKADNMKRDSVLDISDSYYHVKFNSIVDFKESNLIKGKDYFLIWEPKLESIIVYFPRKKESQYLRRIFYSALNESEKEQFYPHYQGNGPDNYYDWKKYVDKPFNFTEEVKNFYRAIGEAIDELPNRLPEVDTIEVN